MSQHASIATIAGNSTRGISTGERHSTLPGPLSGTVTLTLQTAFAQRLVLGRPAELERVGVMGLFVFADLMNTIWHGAAEGDPYGDWWLVRVERALAQTETELRRLQSRVAESLAGFEALSIAPAASVSPVQTALRFTTPQAFQATQLIARCDGIARTVLTARHTACVPTDDATKALWKTGHAMRRTFATARHYERTGVTRSDFIAGTARATYAIEKMGRMPAGVLSGTLLSEYRPGRHLGLRKVEARESPRPESIDAIASEKTVETEPALDVAQFEDDLSPLFS